MLTNIQIPALLSDVCKEMAITPSELLRNYVLTQPEGKIHKYETEDARFRKKYSCEFKEFRARVEAVGNEENFEWEDDLTDWEFAAENLALWRKRESQCLVLFSLFPHSFPRFSVEVCFKLPPLFGVYTKKKTCDSLQGFPKTGKRGRQTVHDRA